ncbi:NAD(P)H:quinone oxidoreductase [Salipaludibacillus agaradhaerens]|uniref:NAD(P)H:quinone oxidoreductase n=1 Tax=Salipaludibacillus agaradhaerens TaxID=76935 RepID=A0A9Q4AZ46_SALAG|nr:NAD(P)H:quinone oxidoreductase [Salipaludibacillus agaradhaerens]MCR6095458.1 NAD(P)H:quinone oxidoreductase [Salipaludibacillus agaradhaerens]MCR6114982.1 NAD(P)H:quinone oxidoreductase [Salipaludibacillus agaradhaerens]UJW58695.1 NAD(P)H:quinone oxidoreductase [Bacillus sp. A116_S68]
MTKVLVPYYSTYGHIFTMARAIVEGAQEVEGTEVKLVRIEEFDAVKDAMSEQDAYVHAQEAQKDVPVATHDDLRWADGVVWGIPTRYGAMPAQMKQYLDSAGALWANGELEGKVTGIFTSTGSIHGGQETTAITSLVPLLHFGFIFVGLPYGENPEQLTTDGIGGSPYSASTIAGPDGSSQPDQRDLLMAKRLGKRVASVAKALRS